MAVEPRRGCGYRKVGGLYLVAAGLWEACHRLPWPLTVCPTCGAGIVQARGWTWVTGEALFQPRCRPMYEASRNDASAAPHIMDVPNPAFNRDHCPRCVVCTPERFNARDGLLWVGAQFYSAASFVLEASALGVSRRIASIPRGFVVGVHWVLLAHRYAIARPAAPALISEDDDDDRPGVFAVFRPERVEQIVKQSELESKRADLEKRGITPVPVPDDDPDHMGSVYDKSEAPASETLSEAARRKLEEGAAT